jgi:hypothetical protein
VDTVTSPITDVVDTVVPPVADVLPPLTPITDVVDTVVPPVADVLPPLTPIADVVDTIVPPLADVLPPLTPMSPAETTVASPPAQPPVMTSGTVSQTAPTQTGSVTGPARETTSVSAAPAEPMPATRDPEAPLLQKVAPLPSFSFPAAPQLATAIVPAPAGAAARHPLLTAPAMPALSFVPSTPAAATPLDALRFAPAADRVHAAIPLAGVERSQPDPRVGLDASSGGAGGGGFSPLFFLALLSALVLARMLYERMRLPSFCWRPAVFLSLQERPG